MTKSIGRSLTQTQTQTQLELLRKEYRKYCIKKQHNFNKTYHLYKEKHLHCNDIFLSNSNAFLRPIVAQLTSWNLSISDLPLCFLDLKIQ